MKGKTQLSYEYLIFRELIYEYDSSQRENVEAKIKRKLKYYGLAPYDQKIIDHIRSLKETLSNEVRLQGSSKYFNKTPSEFAQIEDFDIERMVADYKTLYADLSEKDIRDMIGWGVHWFHTR